MESFEKTIKNCNLFRSETFNNQLSVYAGQIHKEIKSNSFDWSTENEDVHLNIERRLVQIVGDPGKKLHTGRSRNDQVATDLHLWLKKRIDDIDLELKQLQKTSEVLRLNITSQLSRQLKQLVLALVAVMLILLIPLNLLDFLLLLTLCLPLFPRRNSKR